MKQTVFRKRIPTFFGLILITIGIIFTTWYAEQNKLTYEQQASALTEPQNVSISNITDTSFTISYTTKGPATGSLSYDSQKKLGKLGLDERDQINGNPAPYTTHFITVTNLKPATIYYFAIMSGTDQFLQNGNPYQITTGTTITQNPTSQFPMVGKIVTPEGKSADNVLVYVTGDTTQTLATITKNSGTFSLPLNSMRISSLTSYATLAPTSKLTITAVNSTDKTTAILLANQAQPVPAMTLNQNYDFTSSIDPINSPTSSQTHALPTPVSTTSSAPQILNPEKDNQHFTDPQPEFTGIAVPNSEVSIEIHSDNSQTATVTSGPDGSWTFRPASPLPPGQHTITMITKDALGIVHKITKNFTVYAAGSQLGTGPTVPPTIPVTPTQTPSPTKPTQSVTPSVNPTATPTGATLSNSPTPTIVSSVSATLSPTTTPNRLPKAGSNIVLIAGTLGAVIMGIGFVLFFVP